MSGYSPVMFGVVYRLLTWLFDDQGLDQDVQFTLEEVVVHIYWFDFHRYRMFEAY